MIYNVVGGKNMRYFISSLIVTLSTAGSAWAQWCPYNWEKGSWMMGWGAMVWFMPVLMISFWVMVIIAAIFFIRWMMGHRTSKVEETASDILKKKYARGEINKEEFEQKKKDIQ